MLHHQKFPNTSNQKSSWNKLSDISCMFPSASIEKTHFYIKPLEELLVNVRFLSLADISIILYYRAK